MSTPTAQTFRTLALALPFVDEGEHMGHPDFRVGSTPKKKGPIFASLPPVRSDAAGSELGMVKLPPARQAEFVRDHPQAFTPAAGAWGRAGCTYVILAKTTRSVLQRALKLAWEAGVPKFLMKELAAPVRKTKGDARSRKPKDTSSG